MSPQTIADASGLGTEGTCPTDDGEKFLISKKIIPKDYAQIPTKKGVSINAKSYTVYSRIAVGKDHNRNARINFGLPKQVVDPEKCGHCPQFLTISG